MAAKSKKTPYGAFSMGMFSPDKSFVDSSDERIRQLEQAGPPRSAMNSSPRRPSEDLNSDMSALMAQRDLAAAEKLFGKQDLGGEPMPSGSAALRANSSTQPTPTMAQSESAAGFEGIQRAKAVAPTDDKMLMSVFKTTMGSDFDPNSKTDKRKLDELRSFMASKPDLQGMSANKIALAFYRRK